MLLTIVATAILVCIIGSMVIHAARGNTIPFSLCVSLVVFGALLLLAPSAASLLHRFIDDVPSIEGHQRIFCFVYGGVMAVAGAGGTLSFFSNLE